MTRMLVTVVVAGIIGIAIVATYHHVSAEQQQPAEQGQQIPGCDVPKAFGRLVTITSGNNNGLAGQAVFEAEDGTIRWVPFMFSATEVITQKPSRRSPPTIFPILPTFECAVGHVWQRP